MSSLPLLETLGTTGILLLAGALAAWTLLGRRMSVRRSLVFWALLVLAVSGPAALRVLTAPRAFDATWLERAGRRYEAMWDELDAASLAAAAGLETLELATGDRLTLFRRLEGMTRPAGPTLLLLDPDGRAAAWAGEGLLHDLEKIDLPSTGPAFRSSYSAVTLASVRRVGGQGAPWRLVAGKSHASQRLPFPSPDGGRRGDYLWSVVAAGSRLPAGAGAVDLEGRPTLSVLAAPEAPLSGASRHSFLLQMSWLALALACFVIGGDRSRRTAALDLFGLLEAPAVLGVLALATAARLAPLAVGLLAVSLGLAWVSRRLSTRRPMVRWSWLLAPLGVGAVFFLAFRLEKVVGPVDLGTSLTPPANAIALRLAVFLILVAAFVPAMASTCGASRARLRYLWPGALLLLALGTALADRALVAGGCVVTAAALGACWMRSTELPSPLSTVLVLAAASALTAGATWEVGYRALTARYLERDIAPLLGPPSEAEKQQLRADVAEFFEGFDLAALAAADPRTLEQTDLAYALWARSPLAVGGRLSSLTVVLDGLTVSTFEFGIPLTRIGEVDRSPELWQELAVPGWEEALVPGRSTLRFRGRAVGTLFYGLLPRPGFRLITEPGEQLTATLVRGTLTSRMPIQELVEPAVFAVYAERPRPSIGPREAPALTEELLAEPRFTTTDGDTRLRGWTRRSAGATEVILLRDADPLESLERVGVQAVGTLLVLAGLLVPVILAAGLRLETLSEAWNHVYRSYSRKLLLVYATMLLVPLLVVSLALLGVLGERLQRTREVAGRTAMDAAQNVLGEYVLSLEPGFGVDTALDDALLGWLSRVVRHEVNLYWGSTLYASSNPELFTAGLLPPRIPGEVYAQLTLESALTASRINQASGEQYLEIYAPLRVPGVSSQELLFLSIPLLAQQEEVQREIALLRTRAVLVALVLLIGVIAMARRLSRGFTRPLTDLIAGTESIAAGARSLDLEPTELELAALVRAVNSMASHIAEGRERLMVEKQVVDKVVENITAAVVSLDRERRVVLANDVAKERLGVEVGRALEESLSERSQWRPLLDFVAAPVERTRQRTLRIQSEDSGESEWTVIWVPIRGEGEPTSLLVVEDVTEVLRVQRLEAWAEMARMIAHEIKNPLTPIRLSTEHMMDVHRRAPRQFDEVFDRCAQNILRQVDELQQIAGEFSTYSRIPKIRPTPGDLVAATTEVVDSYRAAPPPGVELRLEHDAERLPLSFDRRLYGRALRNLIENAIRASPEGGDIVVRTAAEDGLARVSVADRGQGADAETLQRMFDPYFSTDSAGTGLGLPISRQIVEEHGGTITAANRHDGGLRVVISLPLERRVGEALEGAAGVN